LITLDVAIASFGVETVEAFGAVTESGAHAVASATSAMLAQRREGNGVWLDMWASWIRGRRGVGGDADAPTIEDRRYPHASRRRYLRVTGQQVEKRRRRPVGAAFLTQHGLV